MDCLDSFPCLSPRDPCCCVLCLVWCLVRKPLKAPLVFLVVMVCSCRQQMQRNTRQRLKASVGNPVMISASVKMSVVPLLFFFCICVGYLRNSIIWSEIPGSPEEVSCRRPILIQGPCIGDFFLFCFFLFFVVFCCFCFFGLRPVYLDFWVLLWPLCRRHVTSSRPSLP